MEKHPSEEITLFFNKYIGNDFFIKNRVEVIFDSSQQYLCYINYKEGEGAYGLGMNFIEALINGIEKFNLHNR